MALILEGGMGVPDADSYVALAGYQAYGAARGWVLETDDAANEINLRRAFDALNRNWMYLGKPVQVDQAGAFPRSVWEGIPMAIISAQCELAFLIQGGLDPFATGDGSTSETIKIGPITIGGDTLPTDAGRIKAVEGLLRPFLASGPGLVRMIRG